MGFRAIYSILVTLQCNRVLFLGEIFSRNLGEKWDFIIGNYRKSFFVVVNARINCFFTKNSDKITLRRWFLQKSELYFISYISRSKTYVFDIYEPKSYTKMGQKYTLTAHLTQLDEIYPLVRDLMIYDEFLYRLFFTLL
jgi:hypothetical protein